MLHTCAGVQNPTAEHDLSGFCLQAAQTAQTIWPQYLPSPDIQSDDGCMRYELAANLRTMAKQRRLTDLTVEVDGRQWEVHRLILASCSPIFEDFVECGLFPGMLQLL